MDKNMNIKKIQNKIRFKLKMWFKFIFILPDYFTFRSKDISKHCVFSIWNVYPCLTDKTKKTHFEKQYIYHSAWAVRCIKNINPQLHSDFGSILYFSTILSAFIPVDFYDYRVANIELSNLKSKFSDLTNIKIESNSLLSVSCMHTIEHVGLGRYGDPIDPEGDLKAISELKRITKKNGALLIVVPIGRIQSVVFNAHRIYEYNKFISYFDGFELVEFSYIPEEDNRGGIIINTSGNIVENDTLGCGCFWFKKK